MATIKSPYRENNVNINKLLGSNESEAKFNKKKAFPNQYFATQEEYFEFTSTYGVYGKEANTLKKLMDKDVETVDIPLPVIKVPKESKNAN